MRNIRLTLQYDGTDYSGWQVQKKGTATIQGLLEKAIFNITKEESRVTGAGRTDAGVHALEYVAAFKTSSSLDPHTILRALNANMPEDIHVTGAEECPEDFHPRYSARDKTYTYLISEGAMYPVFLKRYTWQIVYNLDFEVMKKAAAFLPGKHDFSCFRASGCSSKNPIREVRNISVLKIYSVEFINFNFHQPLIKIRITANAFLRHMARNIVGTLVEAGKGKLLPRQIEEILESKDRNKAGPTAPACGLFLEKITY